jgi:antitoxin PrlF
MHTETNLTSKGQMTIPKLFREAMGIETNGRVEMDLMGRELVVRRHGITQERARRAADTLREIQMLKDIPLTTDEIMEITRGKDWKSSKPND